MLPRALRARDRTGRRRRRPGAATFDDERQAEGQQQPVERIEPVEVAQQQPLDDDTEQPDGQRRETAARPSS